MDDDSIKSKSISHSIASFNASKSPFDLAKAVGLLLKKRRLSEAIYGLYCNIFAEPSKVFPRGISVYGDDVTLQNLVTKSDLFESYGHQFAIHLLPEDFIRSRVESVIEHQGKLLIGEYGFSGSRIFVLTRNSCTVNDYYSRDKKVRHIHALCGVSGSNKVLVSTGDSAKYLDEWNLEEGKFKRLRSSLAGYTGMIEIGGKVFMGTDFSGRPNYIETLEGEKYFFPEKAFKMQVIKFQRYRGRFIISLNRDLKCFGGRYVVSVFDTVKKEFIFCEYYDDIMPHAQLRQRPVSHDALVCR